jgi:hypothetical protein
LAKSLKHDGSAITFDKGLEFSARFYLKSVEDFLFYINEFHRKGFMKLFPYNTITFTMDGLDYVDNLNEIDDESSEGSDQHYDVALSFAGENRGYVEQVAVHLRNLGVNVFYDDYEKIDLWGKDLYQHLSNVYSKKCNYCIVFVSAHYANKLWTKHELRNAQERAFKENREYILPVKFDNTELPGLPSTTGYLDATTTTPQQLAELTFRKVKDNFINQ